jgi:peptidoglycan hydrolase-like protein with peptidoglycan-binding domain
MRLRYLAGGLLAIAGLAAAAILLATSSPRASGVRRAEAVVALRPTRLTALPHRVVADGTAPLVVGLSGPVAAASPPPALSPGVAGAWTRQGRLETFRPASTLQPCAAYRLTIWARTAAAGQAPLGRRRVLALAVACPSVRAAQQALARLRYLPYAVAGAPAGRRSRARAARSAFHPPRATLLPRLADGPPLAEGQLDATTRGALMVFQTDHGLSPSGTPDAPTWAALLGAEAAGRRDPRPYTFVTVSQATPQTLAVHQGGRVVLTSPTNTGVAGAPTADGIFPIFERLASTTMSGTNPDGSHYSDPGVPWVNYFNGGDAVHGFDRASYGSAQSDGCVELPPSTAAAVYGLLSVGDLVEVNG